MRKTAPRAWMKPPTYTNTRRNRPDMGTKGYVIAQLNIIPPTKEDERRAMRTVAVSVPKDEVRPVLQMLGLA